MELKIEFFMRGERRETAEALRDYVQRRLAFAVRPFAQRIRRLTVRLIDENGPRRGIDSRCSITVELTDGGKRFVEVTGAWPFGAITGAARRLSEVLRRDAERRKAAVGVSRRSADPR